MCPDVRSEHPRPARACRREPRTLLLSNIVRRQGPVEKYRGCIAVQADTSCVSGSGHKVAAEVAITIEWLPESAENTSESAPTLCQRDPNIRVAAKAGEASILFVRVRHLSRRTKCRDHMAILEKDFNRGDGAFNVQQCQGQSSAWPVPILKKEPSRYVPENSPYMCLQCEPDGKGCESRVPIAGRNRCPQLTQG